MLLSHNFDVSSHDVPALSREAFAEVFREGLRMHEHLQCRLLNHPHWMVEIRFLSDLVAPPEVGELCAKALAEKRQGQHLGDSLPSILVLGGLKTTPPTSDSPDALQPGEWGVDVVETVSIPAFLQKIAWEATISQRPADSVFKVELKDA